MIKNFKKNQIVVFVIALMFIAAGYLNFTTNEQQNLLPTSALADSEQMAAIGDATLVSANQVTSENKNTENSNEIQNSIQTTNSIESNQIEQSNNKGDENNKDSYFTQSRLDRDTMYSQMLSNYQAILESNNIEVSEKTIAQEEIKRINNEKNAIMIAENLIKTKGFEDVILFINNGNVSVIIKAGNLEEEQVAQIQNIITRELQVEVKKINVTTHN